ncbi:MAG: carbohydrate porin [Ignavibacterium sp.]|nr:carbohydrate porin [Ignavibacterium sp.]
MLEEKVDSLSLLIENLRVDLEKAISDKSPNTDSIDELKDSKEEPDSSIIPQDQRSKNKRIDELLRALEERPGALRFNGSATTSLQSGLKNNFNKLYAVSSFDIFALTSFGNGTLLFFDIEAIGGNGIDEITPTLSGLNGDVGSLQDVDGIDRLQVLEAWGEFTIFDELFTVTAGKIDLTNYFDNNKYANDETLQFLSNPFVNNPAFAVPGNSPGVRFRTTILGRFYFQVGFANANNSGSDILNNVYKIIGTGLKILPNTEWEANLHLYNYWHPIANDAAGFGLSFDETIFGKYQVYARYGKNSKGLSDWYGIESSWSAGLSFLQNIDDQGINIGVAYGITKPSGNSLQDERLLELYTRYQINQWVYCSPHFQVVWNSLGSNNNYSVLGLRVHFNF